MQDQNYDWLIRHSHNTAIQKEELKKHKKLIKFTTDGNTNIKLHKNISEDKRSRTVK